MTVGGKESMASGFPYLGMLINPSSCGLISFIEESKNPSEMLSNEVLFGNGQYSIFGNF